MCGSNAATEIKFTDITTPPVYAPGALSFVGGRCSVNRVRFYEIGVSLAHGRVLREKAEGHQ
jgi:hypothetical protein